MLFLPIKKQQDCLKFACYGQIKIESEVCVMTEDYQCHLRLSREIVTLCARKVNDNAADFKLNFIQRLTFTTNEEGKIKLIMFIDILTDSSSRY